MKGTKAQFATLLNLLDKGGTLEDVTADASFEGVIRVKIKHYDQRDGDWTDTYLIGDTGEKIKIK